MNDLLEFVLKIEERPGLWIGNTDTGYLFQFLSGYCLAKSEGEDGFKGHFVSEYGKWLFDDFRIYLATKYKDSRTFNWAGLIINNEPDGNSTDAFFRLLHEYLADHTV